MVKLHFQCNLDSGTVYLNIIVMIITNSPLLVLLLAAMIQCVQTTQAINKLCNSLVTQSLY